MSPPGSEGPAEDQGVGGVSEGRKKPGNSVWASEWAQSPRRER